jgi:ATP-binding cassette, subfamily B, bacterial MsbA
MLSTVVRVLQIIARRRGLAAVSFLCMLVVSATTVAYAFLAGPLLSALVQRDARSLGSMLHASVSDLPGGGPAIVAATVLAVTVARAVAVYGQRMASARLAQDVVRSLRQRMYTHLLHVVPGALVGQRPGDFASRLSSDVLQVQMLVSSNLTTILGDLATLAGLIALAFSLDAILASIALAALPPIALAMWWLAAVVRRTQRRVWQEQSLLASEAAEMVAAVPVIRAYGAEPLVEREFAARAREVEQRSLTAQRWAAIAGPAVQVLGGVALVSALIWSTGRLSSGELAVDTFVSFFAAMLLVYRPVGSLGATVHRMATGLAALDRVDEISALPLDAPDAPGAIDLPYLQEGLELRGVGHAYRDGEPILSAVDFSIARGESVAIVGASGVGKTTILMIVLGLLEPREGRVAIDGVDRTKVTRASWRSQFAWVPQEPLIFADTVIANVALADAEPDLERARTALRDAGAIAFVDALPGGLDTVLSEGGKELSGGQRQRLCIARALYRGSPILLFDEPTSSLDGPAEREIAETIEGLMGKRAVLLVSHRWSTVKRADRVVVIDAGRVIESGSPERLWKTGGRFHELFRDAALH